MPRLYLSPIKPTEVQRCVSPYEWARQEFEPPEGHGPPPPDTLLAQLTDVSTPGQCAGPGGQQRQGRGTGGAGRVEGLEGQAGVEGLEGQAG